MLDVKIETEKRHNLASQFFNFYVSHFQSPLHFVCGRGGLTRQCDGDGDGQRTLLGRDEWWAGRGSVTDR